MPASRQHFYDDGKCALTLHIRQNVIGEIQKKRPGGLDFPFECTGLIQWNNIGSNCKKVIEQDKKNVLLLPQEVFILDGGV